MPNTQNKIPTLRPEDSAVFHFGYSEGIKLSSSLFHINRIEDYRDKILLPLPPHRKIVSDLLFITEGTSIRSKGLNEYAFSQNQFFFLPALHMTSHKMMSKISKGTFYNFIMTYFLVPFYIKH